jgi:DNA-binding transcriptional LysR family regulator
MNIHTLKIFCDVIETCSFSETAQLNFVTQSAVSQQINALEKKYEDPLFIRGRGRFDLTPIGKILYNKARDILRTFQSIESEIMMSKNVVSGKIKLSTIYSIGLHELPPLIKAFMIEYKNVNVHLEYARMNKVIQDVTTGSVDLGIVAFPKKDTTIDVIPFRKDSLVCIVWPSHPLHTKKTIELSDLNGENFIAFDKDIPTAKAIQNELKEQKIKVNTIMSFDNVETIKRAVEVEAGISIVPKVTVKNEVSQGNLLAIDFKDFHWERPLGMVVRNGREQQAIVKLFIEFLKASKI